MTCVDVDQCAGLHRSVCSPVAGHLHQNVALFVQSCLHMVQYFYYVDPFTKADAMFSYHIIKLVLQFVPDTVIGVYPQCSLYVCMCTYVHIHISNTTFSCSPLTAIVRE